MRTKHCKLILNIQPYAAQDAKKIKYSRIFNKKNVFQKPAFYDIVSLYSILRNFLQSSKFSSYSSSFHRGFCSGSCSTVYGT